MWMMHSSSTAAAPSTTAPPVGGARSAGGGMRGGKCVRCGRQQQHRTGRAEACACRVPTLAQGTRGCCLPHSSHTKKQPPPPPERTTDPTLLPPFCSLPQGPQPLRCHPGDCAELRKGGGGGPGGVRPPANPLAPCQPGAPRDAWLGIAWQAPLLVLALLGMRTIHLARGAVCVALRCLKLPSSLKS